MDTDGNAASAEVTVDEGGVWNLTGNSYVSALVNNGTINKNGYTLQYDDSAYSGSGTINETNDIAPIKVAGKESPTYTLGGHQATASTRGVVIQDGKKAIRK